MPARVKVTKEMILDAAFPVARETGAESINARTRIGKAELLYAAGHVPFRNHRSVETSGLRKGRPVSFGISDGSQAPI